MKNKETDTKFKGATDNSYIELCSYLSDHELYSYKRYDKFITLSKRKPLF